MNITWEVEDGYVGKSRPQYTEISDDEIAMCDTVEEAMDLIDELVHDDFESSITWAFSYWDRVQQEVKQIMEDK